MTTTNLIGFCLVIIATESSPPATDRVQVQIESELCKKITKGMTAKQVNDVVGGPPGDYRRQTFGFF